MITRWLINHLIKFITNIFLRLDDSELTKVPTHGPLLVVVNHVNSLDAPVMISHMDPRPTTSLVKKETWDSPFLGFLFNIWDGIPLDRENADFAAFSLAQKALLEEKILAVAPEGTRTRDGLLIQAKPGIAMLAIKAGVPILPVAYFGHEDFMENLKHLRRTPMKIRVGEPFHVQLNGHARSKTLMQEVADEIMIEIAKLMPEEYRGYYAGLVNHQPKYILADRLAGQHVPQPLGKQFSQA
jgi:1-acyl-sn-glycerol-3-phosphate acyltransferase